MTSHVDTQSTMPEERLVGRRAVARGAAWSVPVVALAVAAPAAAATSGCQTQVGKLDWDVFANGSTQVNKVLATTINGVTVTVTVTGDHAATNGVVTSTVTGGQSKVMRFYDLENKTNTSQTVTITFSKKVQNVSFSLLDVDSQADRPTNAYEDLVTVQTAGWTGVKHSNFKGSGTAADPYRAKTTNSPVDGSSSNSNVDLSWPGQQLTSVSFKYAQDGKVDGGPFIGISDILFQTVC
jgi:hypothetical protein